MEGVEGGRASGTYASAGPGRGSLSGSGNRDLGTSGMTRNASCELGTADPVGEFKALLVNLIPLRPAASRPSGLMAHGPLRSALNPKLKLKPCRAEQLPPARRPRTVRGGVAASHTMCVCERACVHSCVRACGCVHVR